MTPVEIGILESADFPTLVQSMHQQTSVPPWGYEDLDAALLELAPHGPTLANGLTNHAPMVVQALCEMGRGADIPGWLEVYRPQMRPWPELRTGFDPAMWRAALGRPSYVTAWREHFESELSEQPWTETLAQWTPRLSPGAVGAALHGLIRVGHAVRALDAWETAPRRRELAAALACWSASYAELPTRRAAAPTILSPREALARVEFVPLAARRNEGAISTALKVLDDQPSFAPVIDLPSIDGDLGAAAEAFAVLFAEVFLANVRSPLSAIVFTHGVTGFAAADALLPHLDRQAGVALLRHVWQAAAALYATYGERFPPELPPSSPVDDGEARALVDMAVAHGDDHLIKLTHAGLELVARRAPGCCLLPSELALEVLPPTHGRRPAS
jgi:hypothetical protein